ncbi:MAG TPA: hypothetical protein VJB60_04450 [Candidatus Peribacterales bacterium]|nr:hypothetical protein [Candidatus Peribacterales bacterium]
MSIRFIVIDHHYSLRDTHQIQEQEPLDDPDVIKIDEDGTRLY